MTRARDLGVIVGSGTPGPGNAITDVAGVRVGHTTLVRGDGPLRVGEGPVRTGVTVILPHAGSIFDEPLYAGHHWLNGNGELTGMAWVREGGMLTTPIALTNSHSVGVVRDALIEIEVRGRGRGAWGLPVVGETWDGVLNDIDGQHVTAAHVREAYDAAASGPVAEGNVGGGTGMICHGFKGGIGTASRVVDGGWTVGVLVQANHGRRERLTVAGVPVLIDDVPRPVPPEFEGAGSIIGIVATDAPLLPHQCRRLAQRAGLGVARTGGAGENTSGDGFLAFSTANRGRLPSDALGVRPPRVLTVEALADAYIDPLFYGAIEATEEAIVNALLAAETMTGRDGLTAHALPPDRLLRAVEALPARPDGPHA
ncbi:DmpA family aminopeptidase [Actinoallomurus rhizosphaericola]|uniref:DmpA family aminopeptidase n=1 Tax=Actinoallomurus rhizosphaericola TaxID=2952536 RepID=UPI002090915D|nr:P1 family peptidase [Actinoallomurus rhizosphaericola]MCO5992173.1 P1 family peptidase [Actinoallomurus rhizosphaericola]